jgi:hypothetical protein
MINIENNNKINTSLSVGISIPHPIQFIVARPSLFPKNSDKYHISRIKINNFNVLKINY